MENFLKKAEAESLSRMAIVPLGTALGVEWLEGSDELGFTSMAETGEKPKVYISWDHEEYIAPLPAREQIAMRMGIYTHELCHQLFTAFQYAIDLAQKMRSQAEAAIFMDFCNTLEDPAIEYFAPTKCGLPMVKSLEYTIRRTYELSPGIEMAPNAYSQLMSALINFGDMGLVKGEWTFPEAKEYFRKIVPLYAQGIEEPDARRRIDIAKECMDICKPLWEEAVKEREFMEEMMKKLHELMEQFGKGANAQKSTSGGGGEKKPSGVPKTSRSKKRDEEAEKMAKEDSEGSSEDAEDSDESDSSGEDSKESSTKSMEDKSKSSKSSSSSETRNTESSEGEEELLDIEFTEDELDEIEEKILDMEKSLSKKESSSKEPEEPKTYEITSAVIKKGCTCENIVESRRSTSFSGHYARLVASMKGDINLMTKSLKKIFEADVEETVRAYNGELNILRYARGTENRIFDKRKDPENKKDSAVFILVDMSGSMSSEKRMESAQKLSITLAESLSAVGVKHYIMGYDADRGGAENINHHFVRWNGGKKDRESLAGMQPYSNNFDGYAIRHATKMLGERKEAHKYLFIISDGLPACYSYRTNQEGVSDTVMAVKEARNAGIKTFGVALGHGCHLETMKSMYKNDFVNCTDVASLTRSVCKKLEKCFKGEI